MKHVCCVCALLALWSAAGQAQQVEPSDAPLLRAIVVAHGIDLLTSALAIQAGAVEANPLMASPARAVALKVGVGAVQVAVVHHLWRSGHRKAAIVVGLSIAGVYGYVNTRNALIAAQMRAAP